MYKEKNNDIIFNFIYFSKVFIIFPLFSFCCLKPIKIIYIHFLKIIIYFTLFLKIGNGE